jgi:membrane protein DedA with SNARE-associated domain
VLNKAALYVYLGVFFSLVAAGLGFPIPEEIPIVTAGAWAGHAAEEEPADNTVPGIVANLAVAPGLPFPANLPWAALANSPQIEPPPPRPDHVPLRWWIMLPVCIVGVVIGDSFLYGMGRFWGPRLLETRWMRRFMSSERREKIEGNFHRYGVLVLLFARFLPTIRAPIFIMAGTMRVSFARFVVADSLYAIPGVSLLFGLSFWLGDQFRDLVSKQIEKVEKLRPILILALIAGVVAYLIHHFLRHPLATGDPREELPVIGHRVADTMGSNREEGKDPKEPLPQSNGSMNAIKQEQHEPTSAQPKPDA